MKRILLLSMMLVLGLTSLSFAGPDEEWESRSAGSTAVGDDPAEAMGKSLSKSGTEAGGAAIGVKDDCVNCRKNTPQFRLGDVKKSINDPRNNNNPGSTKGGTQ